ncbi:MAG TPA: hypothetical protein VHM70_05155 [Polyangiaceae bacterium]|nr:hypothetical protein [Polyangiaceae bacterium]
MRGIWALGVCALGCGPSYRAPTLRAMLDRQALGEARDMLDGPLMRVERHPKTEARGLGGLVLLERGSVRWAQGDFAGCAQDFAAADRLLDRQALKRVNYLRAGKNPEATVYLFERGWAQAANLPFGPKFYERLLLNPFAAVCRSENDDTTGACVEARRFGVMADYTEQVHAGQAQRARAFGELISAFACQAADPTLSHDALERARRFGVAVDEMGLQREASAAVDDAELWIVAAYGRPSHPESDENWQNVRIVGGPETRPEPVRVVIDGAERAALEVLDVEAAVQDDFRDAENALTVRFMGMTGTTGQWSPQAWLALPAHVHLLVARVSLGEHAVSVTLRGTEYVRRVTARAGPARLVSFFAPW